MDRRNFLKLSAAAGMVVAAPASIAGAREERYDGPYCAVFDAGGGWDPTYLMDPKGTPDLNRLYRTGDIRTAGNINYAPTEGHVAPGAMTNETFFERYASELLVLNGIDMSVNSHSGGSRYMSTGKLDSLRYPTLPALLAATRCPEVPLAFMTFGNYSATGNIIAQTRIPNVTALNNLANADHVYADPSRPYHHGSVISRIHSTLGRVREEGHTLPRVDRAQDFLFAAQIGSTSLDQIVPHIPSDIPDERLQRQSVIALSAFASGLGVAANLSLGGFDSHNDNDPPQLELLPRVLAGVDYFLNRAEELGIRDRVMVFIQSDMGRTPWYNSKGGKDHWSINSMLALGAGISGNRVVGTTTIDSESGYDQSAAVIDATTLADSPDGIRIRPQHIQQAQRELFGIADHPVARQFDLGVAPEERLSGLFG